MNPEVVQGLGITCALIYGTFLVAKYDLLPLNPVESAYRDHNQRIRELELELSLRKGSKHACLECTECHGWGCRNKHS
ncbi:hypothetical protein COLO4_08749 [Corchorus olitorius]|uniref:Uncharacterized protein n=1 Tax=Corchorus olitorius TaxID=93759 RepID=A0A1R3KEW9_9ROSI|nr:hypothetical protein COLO4_08749 [Corchorus olitorius]